MGTPEDRAELALHYQSLGFKAMKLRIHNERMADDLAIVDACLNATDGKMGFMVDANQATNLPSPERGVVWDYPRALYTAKELEARGVIWLEEPLSRYDFDNLIRLREATEIAISGGRRTRAYMSSGGSSSGVSTTSSSPTLRCPKESPNSGRSRQWPRSTNASSSPTTA